MSPATGQKAHFCARTRVCRSARLKCIGANGRCEQRRGAAADGGLCVPCVLCGLVLAVSDLL